MEGFMDKWHVFFFFWLFYCIFSDMVSQVLYTPVLVSSKIVGHPKL